MGLSVGWDYVSAIFHYWWILVVGVLMPLPEIYKVLHPKGKQLDIPYPWRIAIVIAVVFVARFLAYKDASKNLAQAVAEKQHLSSRSYDDNVVLGQLRQQIKGLKAIKQLSSNNRHTSAQTATPISARSDAHPYASKR